METTIKINTDAITNDLILAIKKLFPHKTVEITIQPADETDQRIAMRIGDLIRDVLRNPFDGIGKPEALKYQFKGCWSR